MRASAYEGRRLPRIGHRPPRGGRSDWPRRRRVSASATRQGGTEAVSGGRAASMDSSLSGPASPRAPLSHPRTSGWPSVCTRAVRPSLFDSATSVWQNNTLLCAIAMLVLYDELQWGDVSGVLPLPLPKAVHVACLQTAGLHTLSAVWQGKSLTAHSFFCSPSSLGHLAKVYR